MNYRDPEEIVSYVLYDDGGSIHFTGREDAQHVLKPKPIHAGHTLVEIDHELWNEIQRTYPHWYRFNFLTGRVEKKTLLVVAADKMKFRADGKDSVLVTWEAPEPVRMYVNGDVGFHTNGLRVSAPQSGQITVRVDTHDANYYSDNNTAAHTASETASQGGLGAPLILNAMMPKEQGDDE